jgi:hypothetical protein
MGNGYDFVVAHLKNIVGIKSPPEILSFDNQPFVY